MYKFLLTQFGPGLPGKDHAKQGVGGFEAGRFVVRLRSVGHRKTLYCIRLYWPQRK
jgi:hypothetical protein